MGVARDRCHRSTGLCFGLVLGLGLGLGSGCTARPEKATVQRVVLSLPPSMDRDSAARERLREDVRSQLAIDDLTEITDEADSATHIVKVEVIEELGANDVAKRAVAVELKSLSEGMVLESIGAPGDNPKNWILEAFQDAWSVVTTRRMLRVARERDVIAALKSSDLRVRAAAIGLIGDRKIEAGLEPLCRILEDEDNELLVLRAVGALIALGDPRATDSLIALARNKAPGVVLQVVFAVGSIGGATARGYLVTLASGHPVEAVRRGAKDALDALERRGGR